MRSLIAAPEGLVSWRSSVQQSLVIPPQYLLNLELNRWTEPGVSAQVNHQTSRGKLETLLNRKLMVNETVGFVSKVSGSIHCKQISITVKHFMPNTLLTVLFTLNYGGTSEKWVAFPFKTEFVKYVHLWASLNICLVHIYDRNGNKTGKSWCWSSAAAPPLRRLFCTVAVLKAGSEHADTHPPLKHKRKETPKLISV